MTSPLYSPPGMLTIATTKVVIVNAIANMAAPKLTEINAVSSVDISCYLTGSGWAYSVSENVVTDERMCSEQIFEEPGDYSETLSLTMIYDNISADNDKARLALPPYTQKFAVARIGKKASLPFAVGDLVDVYSFKPGLQIKDAGARNSKHTLTQRMFMNQLTQRDVAVVA